MANQLQLNSGTVFVGLGTQTFTVVTAGFYTVNVKCTVPFDAGSSSDSTESVVSSLVAKIKLNGSDQLTLPTLTPRQGQVEGSVRMNCVATDVITVVLTSSNANDNQLNSVKTQVYLTQG